MAVTVYKCSVCNREIEVGRNKKSLEIIHNCIVTQNCRGNMFVLENLEDYSRGKNSPFVSGLTDWNQRKVLFNFYQTVENSVWTIKHGMKAFPTVFVFVNSPTEAEPDKIIPKEPIDIFIVDENTITLKFERPWSGIAQLIVNTSFPDNTIFETETPVVPLVQLTNNGEITIAILKKSTHSTTVPISVNWIFSSGETNSWEYPADDVQSILSPWRSFNEVEINGLVYELRSFLLQNFLIPTGSHAVFKKINNEPIDKLNEYFLMITKPPFQIFDLDKTKVLDLFEIRNDQLALSYDGANLFVRSDKLNNVFPLIIGL